MISPDRFLAQSNTPDWYRIRETGVTATMAAKAATPAGMQQLVDEIWQGKEEVPDTPYMKFGRDQEEAIVAELAAFGIAHNDWLIAAEGAGNAWKMATPDGLNADHTLIAEVKTTGKDWLNTGSLPIQYRRQVQWQLHVTGAEQCIFAYMLRAENSSGLLVPAWLDPKIVVIERDKTMIASLIQTAQELQQQRVHADEYKEKEQTIG